MGSLIAQLSENSAHYINDKSDLMYVWAVKRKDWSTVALKVVIS